MTSRIKAINHYRPRVKISKTVDTQELAEYIGEISTFHESEVTAMLKELSYVMLKFIRKGRSVKIEGLGTFLPNVELSGRMDLQYRMDAELKTQLKNFKGKIKNKENIGKSPDDLVALWNAEYPDDPVD
jgi:predicted histone-like DNA-binding protein